jgi:hypothetical protein
MDDDLTPSDGLSNRWIEFDGLDCHEGYTDVRFRIYDTDRRDGSKRHVATLSFPVQGSNEFYQIVALGHDALIAFLRQALHLSSILRASYRKEAEKMMSQTES